MFNTEKPPMTEDAAPKKMTPEPKIDPSKVSSPAPEAAAQSQASAEKVAEVQTAQENNDPEFARKFAALSKKEKELFLREKELKERMKLVERYETLDKLKAEDPFKFMQEQGVDFDKLVERAAKEGQEPTVDDKVEALQKRLEDALKRLEEKERLEAQTKEQQVIDNYRRKVHDEVKADPEKFELIHLSESFDDVFDLIHEHFEKTRAETGQGEIIPTAQAAQMVEDYLMQSYQKVVKAKKLMGSPQGKQAEPEMKAQVEDEGGSFSATLTSQMTPRAGDPEPHRKETWEERKQRIANELQAKLRAQQAKPTLSL